MPGGQPGIKDRKDRQDSLTFRREPLRRRRAQMAELVDALASGASASNGVEVRVLFWAPYTLEIIEFFGDFGIKCPKNVLGIFLVAAGAEATADLPHLGCRRSLGSDLHFAGAYLALVAGWVSAGSASPLPSAIRHEVTSCLMASHPHSSPSCSRSIVKARLRVWSA
jgi:hypothetical protein